MSTRADLMPTVGHRALPPKAGAWETVCGRTRYVDDVRLPGTMHMAVVRSTQAHADIVDLDLAEAMNMPDVVDAFGADEVAAATEAIRPALAPETVGAHRVELPALERRVRWAGQPVAVVVARSRRAARRAVAHVTPHYRPLPTVLTADQALAAGAPVLHAEQGMVDNVLMAPRFGRGRVAEALAAAELTARLTVRVPRTTVAPLEPRGFVAAWDEETRRLTVHASHQHPFQLRTLVADALRLSESQVHVLVPHVGGSFGLKMTGAAEEVLVGLASMRLGRPVKWIESREECSLGGSREQVHTVDVGFDRSGRVLALRDRIVVPVGAAGALPGWRMAYVSAAALPTAYDVPHVEVLSRVVVTNQPPWVSARGWGKEAPVLVMEQVMDLVAERSGLDPVHVRERNLIATESMPHRMPSGYSIDSGHFRAVLTAATEQAGLEHIRASCSRSMDSPPEVQGVGVAFELTPEGGSHPVGPVGPGAPAVEVTPESARVEIGSDGGILVATGVTSPGGGNETVIAALVADRFGVTRDQVTVVQGDTDRCPPGTGNASSRGAAVGGAAAVLAADAVLDQCRSCLARLWDTDEESIRLVGGTVRGPSTRYDLAELWAVLSEAGDAGALSATREYRPDSPVGPDGSPLTRGGYPYFSNGAYVAHVRIDRVTGLVTVLALHGVHDCGTVLDTRLVEGQLHGAMAMGAALAVQEEVVLGADGIQLTGTFKEYLVPRANDVPAFTVGHIVTPSPRTLLGAKGGGEAGLGGAQAAVVNAVADAVRRHTGRRPGQITLPLTPPRVRRLLRGEAA